MIQFNNTYAALPEEFYSKNLPEKIANPELVLWNQELAHELALNLDERAIVQIFSGNQIQKSSIPLSMAYSGHQFGHFSPVLGDGRAHLLGEIKNFDIHLKGSGRNAFSRRGDGKAALGPMIKEYIMSEAMYRYGVPTNRSLCVIKTNEMVMRETPLMGGILTRVSRGFIRVGTFEYFASQGKTESLKTLFNYTLDRLYPQIEKNVYVFFETIIQAQAKLIAQWMSLGFIHGVMNTDNVSLAGETMDYGPCAFLDEFDFNKTYSFIDKSGRYAYGQQPEIIKWNLIKLAEALFPLTADPFETYQDRILKLMDVFDSTFESEWNLLFLTKLGIKEITPENKKVIQLWLTYLQKNRIDFTLGHRQLADLLQPSSKKLVYIENEDFKIFESAWKKALGSFARDEKIKELNQINPAYIPRPHLVEKAIEAGYNNDFSELKNLLEVLKNPYQSISGKENYEKPPQENEKVEYTFCGT